MGTSAALSTSNQYIKYKITITQNSQNVANNTSNVTVSVRFYRTNTGYTTYGSGKVFCKINGSTYSATVTTDHKITNSGIVLFSKTLNIPHNTDGSKTLTVSAWIDHNVVTSSEQSYSQVLTTIPRASTFSVSSTSADMGSSVTFNITRASTSFTHTLLLTWGGVTSTIASSVATSRAWTIPLTLANDLPNSTSSGCIITCITYNGSTEIGRKTLVMTIRVPASVKPSISNIAVSEATSGLASKFGAYIQDHSKLKVVTTAAGSYSSTIKSYAVKILGKTYSGSTITSSAITSSGSVAIAVTVTDSRGRTATSTVNVTVLAYSAPTITTLTAQRCDSDGTLNDEGEYVKLTYAFNITALNDKNDKAYTIAYKLKEATDFTTLTSGSAYSADTTYIPSTTFSGDESYDFRVTVSDYFIERSSDADVSTAFTLTDYHSSGTGMSIGKVAEQANTFEVALNAEFTKTLRAKRGIYIEDTRDENLTPEEYRALGRGVYYEFKRCAAVGLSDTSNTYCSVETFVQWNNTSGGSVKQMLFDNDRVWYRYGDSTVWSAWKPILYRMTWQTVDNGVSYKIHDGMCTVRGNSNNLLSISPSGVVACTLPAAAWPTVEIFGSLTTKSTGVGQFSIGTDGTVKLWNLSATSTYWAFTITYPID